MSLICHGAPDEKVGRIPITALPFDAPNTTPSRSWTGAASDAPNAPIPHWREYNTTSRRTSIVIDPPNGRLPSRTATARPVPVQRCGSLARGEMIGRDAVEPAGKPGQRAYMGVDRRTPVIFEQIIVDVNAVHRRPSGVDLIEEREVIVDEVR